MSADNLTAPESAIVTINSTLFPNQVESVVGAIADIIEDVTHSAMLAAARAVEKWIPDAEDGLQDCIAEEVRATVDSYVANHYGDEEFGL